MAKYTIKELRKWLVEEIKELAPFAYGDEVSEKEINTLCGVLKKIAPEIDIHKEIYGKKLKK